MSGSAGDPPGEDLYFSEKTKYGEFGWVKLTGQEYESLERIMGAWELERCIRYIDESAQLTGNRNRWKDWYLLLQRCYRGRWHDAGKKEQPVPMGASGELGEAELEAIRAVLAMD